MNISNRIFVKMSSPMIAWVPVVNRIYSYLTADRSKALQSIELPSVEIHNIETAQEKRPRTLKHLLKANHINFAVYFHDDMFINHTAHTLSSAYLLGANPDQLHQVYNAETKNLLPWRDPPGEISDTDWRDFLGKKEYERAFLDFFEDELALKYQYDWKQVVEKYLFTGPNPLINCLTPDREFRP
jgi:Questin oxidase-like